MYVEIRRTDTQSAVWYQLPSILRWPARGTHRCPSPLGRAIVSHLCGAHAHSTREEPPGAVGALADKLVAVPVCVCLCVFACVCVRGCVCACMRVCVRVCVRACVCACVCAGICVSPHVHACGYGGVVCLCVCAWVGVCLCARALHVRACAHNGEEGLPPVCTNHGTNLSQRTARIGSGLPPTVSVDRPFAIRYCSIALRLA